MDEKLNRNIVFTNHNLVTDSTFGEMHLIVCRNVLIYFDRTLQNKVFSLFHESLNHRGFLCLGSKESLEFSEIRQCYEAVSPKWKIFRKQLPR
jgi:chemotaxis protein methyltransferase CheR